MEIAFGTAIVTLGSFIGTQITVQAGVLISRLRRSHKVRKSLEKNHAVLRHPKTPEILEHAEGWHRDDTKCVGIVLGKEGEQVATSKNIINVQDFLDRRFKAGIRLPKNTLAVSFAAGANFIVGNSTNEFIPNPKHFEMPEEAFFTYQMISDYLQLTFFNFDGTAYLAGMCWYLTPKTQKDYCYSEKEAVVWRQFLLAEQFPPSNRRQLGSYKILKKYGRYCESAGKRVVVLINDDGVAGHYHYFGLTKTMKCEDCKECAEDHENYEFVPPKKTVKRIVAPKVVVPVAVPVPAPEVVKAEESAEEDEDEEEEEESELYSDSDFDCNSDNDSDSNSDFVICD